MVTKGKNVLIWEQILTTTVFVITPFSTIIVTYLEKLEL